MLIAHLRYLLDGPYRRVCDEAKAARLLSSLVFEDYAIFEDSKLLKVIAELAQGEVVRKTANKDFAILRIREIDRLSLDIRWMNFLRR